MKKNRQQSLLGLAARLRHFMKNLKQIVPLSASSEIEFGNAKTGATTKVVPGDVKKGHFAVTASKDGEEKRFIVELAHLSNPAFLRLLEKAKEEFGFQQKGVLSVPCCPGELQMVLDNGRKVTEL